ncbi:MAG: putative DNA binding domain-containing protein [Candidatus Latescibacterota bacterium]|nr:MAG: putative DNA binding domain-containing protein [Candidatus Latescibacterota bacterium]
MRREIPRPRTLIILLLLAGAVVAALVIELSSGVRREIRRSLMQRTADRAEVVFQSRVRGLFDPLEKHLRITGEWGRRGALDLNDQDKLNNLFIPMLEQYPAVTSMLIANERGREYMLLRESSAWLTRSADAEAAPGRVRWRRWAAGDSIADDWWEDVDYDPRKRPWYTRAIEEEESDGDVRLTRPYPFFTTRQIGVTLSKRWSAMTGDDVVDYVAGVDVPLDSILVYVEDLLADFSGESFLLSADHRVFAAGTAPIDSDDSALGTRDPVGVEARALAAWEAVGSVFGDQLTVSVAGTPWWVDFRPVSSDSTPPFLGIAVPESSFAGEVRSQQLRFELMLAGLLLLGGLVTFAVGQVIARRGGSDAGPDLDTEAGLLKLIAGGEGDGLEFKATMRWNIIADKPGKEVEMSWLKTVVAFLNTDGGVLIIGVNDEGEATGIAADRFANDDKFLLHFNNLFKQHIGLPFREYVRADIRTIDDTQVFVVSCASSPEPVFLKQGKEERFYVRVGPSSRQLSVSEVVKRFKK